MRDVIRAVDFFSSHGADVIAGEAGATELHYRPVGMRRSLCYVRWMASSRGPGPLAAVHRITIGTALLGSLAYFAWEVSRALSGAGAEAVVRAALTFGVTVGLGIYFVSLRGLAARLTPRG